MTSEDMKLSKVMDLVNQVQGILSTISVSPTTSRADSLIETIRFNIDNKNLTDSEFRDFIRRSI